MVQAMYIPEDKEHFETLVSEITIYMKDVNKPIEVESPKTGDNIKYYIITLVIAITGLIGLGISRKVFR